MSRALELLGPLPPLLESFSVTGNRGSLGYAIWIVQTPISLPPQTPGVGALSTFHLTDEETEKLADLSEVPHSWGHPHARLTTSLSLFLNFHA